MRQLKQLLYGLFYIVIWAAIIYGVYFLVFRVPPSCSDGKQNGSETGVDCGGKCNLVCLPPALQPIQVSEPLRILPLSSNAEAPRASLFFEVQNPNEGVAARSFPYTITLYDSSGLSRGVYSGTSYIYEREVKYIVLPNVDLPEGVSRGEVKIGVPEWVDSATLTKPALSVLDARAVSNEGWVRAEGTVVSRDTLLLPEVTLSALFYDTQGNVVAVSTFELDRLEPYEPRAFSVAHPFDSRINTNRAPFVVVEALRP